jgi:hypothetical protein
MHVVAESFADAEFKARGEYKSPIEINSMTYIGVAIMGKETKK